MIKKIGNVVCRETTMQTFCCSGDLKKLKAVVDRTLALVESGHLVSASYFCYDSELSIIGLSAASSEEARSYEEELEKAKALYKKEQKRKLKLLKKHTELK